MILVISVILVALVFEYINGFHDTANSIATVVELQPIHGFAAETTAATIIQLATHLGIPLSTTHVIASAIMGVGATKRFSAVKWGIVERMVWAWILTLPVTAFLGYAFYWGARFLT